MKAIALIVLSLIVCASGCTSIVYSSPDGAQVRVVSFGTSRAIEGLDVAVGNDGARSMSLTGHQSDAAAMSAITEAAVRGAVRGAKP